MTITKLRSLVAIAIVSVWVITIIFSFLLMVFGLIDVKAGLDMLQTFSALSSGFVGMIVGYLFSKKD